MSSVNTYKLPFIGGMYEIASQMFESEYYGYINADILLSPNVFDILERCKLNAQAGLIHRRVCCDFQFYYFIFIFIPDF